MTCENPTPPGFQAARAISANSTPQTRMVLEGQHGSQSLSIREGDQEGLAEKESVRTGKTSMSSPGDKIFPF